MINIAMTTFIGASNNNGIVGDETKPLETVSMSPEETIREEIHSTDSRNSSKASNTWVGYPKQVMGHAFTSNTATVYISSIYCLYVEPFFDFLVILLANKNESKFTMKANIHFSMANNSLLYV